MSLQLRLAVILMLKSYSQQRWQPRRSTNLKVPVTNDTSVITPPNPGNFSRPIPASQTSTDRERH